MALPQKFSNVNVTFYQCHWKLILKFKVAFSYLISIYSSTHMKKVNDITGWLSQTTADRSDWICNILETWIMMKSWNLPKSWRFSSLSGRNPIKTGFLVTWQNLSQLFLWQFHGLKSRNHFSRKYKIVMDCVVFSDSKWVSIDVSSFGKALWLDVTTTCVCQH